MVSRVDKVSQWVSTICGESNQGGSKSHMRAICKVVYIWVNACALLTYYLQCVTINVLVIPKYFFIKQWWIHLSKKTRLKYAVIKNNVATRSIRETIKTGSVDVITEYITTNQPQSATKIRRCPTINEPQPLF